MSSSSSLLLWIVRALILLQFVAGALSWGKEVFYFEFLQSYLNEDATAAVNELLPDYAEGDLASLCSWADHIKWRYRWSSALHYVDTPDFFCNYEFSRDCHDSSGHRNACVVAAIYNYTDQLSSEYHNPGAITNYNLTEALLFLSHFIGDIHQDNELPLWGECRDNETVCPNRFASESISLACKYAYRNATPGSTLKDNYFLSRLPIVEERLAQAGVRLAASLNRIFTSKVKTAGIAES
ncbi:Endonuclease 5 [Linum perenne]